MMAVMVMAGGAAAERALAAAVADAAAPVLAPSLMDDDAAAAAVAAAGRAPVAGLAPASAGRRAFRRFGLRGRSGGVSEAVERGGTREAE